MRPDLDKCTTECYRRGAGSLEHTYKIKFGGKVAVHTDPDHEYEDEYGGFHSSARHRHKECKDFGDKLGALRGNIRANVGRRWNDVFSEFCRHLDRRSNSGYHIWTHLQWEVTINTYMGEDGIVYERSKYGNNFSVDGYYVHPLTGILEYAPRQSWKRRWRKKKPAIEDVQIPVPGQEDSKYCFIEGLWFRCKPAQVKVWISDYRSDYNWVYTEKKSANRKEILYIKAQLAKMGLQ